MQTTIESWQNLWNWWQGSGTPAAAIQQFCFIVFTGTATVVGLISLNSWKRQQRSSTVTSASKDVSDSAALVLEHVLIERLSPLPMVYFSDMKGFDAKWQAIALNRIGKEIDFWEAHTAELDERMARLKGSVAKHEHLLGSRKLDGLIAQIRGLVEQYVGAIGKRKSFIQGCRAKNTEAGYAQMVSLANLARRHPILWRKERNLQSVQYETDLRKAMDSLRSYLAQRK